VSGGSNFFVTKPFTGFQALAKPMRDRAAAAKWTGRIAMADKTTYNDKKPVRGYKYKLRGSAKKTGGFGLKIVGKTKRWFKPNLQRVKIIEADGTVKRVWITAKSLKGGLVTKAPKQSLMAAKRAEVKAAKEAATKKAGKK
jgi:large subunit ribosomal protein L28